MTPREKTELDVHATTMADSSAGHGAASAVDVAGTLLHGEGFDARYHFRSPLGEGGMGDVRLYRDTNIGRDVAVKTMQPRFTRDAQSVARFLREARIQGQLEHPSIVPVHDMSIGADGEPFFTMKRVRGTTLETVIDDARASGVRDARFSIHKLLSAFVSVCLAVDFAHHRRVLHRDLKPANIMLGDFGEVYVLDWGIAKVEGEESEPIDDLASTNERPPVDITNLDTRADTLLGTPGFISPEQIRGERASMRSDVYALGAILFEILTLEPLNDGVSAPEIAAATLKGADLSTKTRSIAPELATICGRATALDPKDRFEDARTLSHAVERYLEGDRDLERRRTLAAEHVDDAKRALSEAQPSADDFVRSHTTAMRGIGQALALDPENHEALATLVKVFADVPPEEPAEVRDAIAASTNRAVRAGMRGGAVMPLAWFLFLPLGYWCGMRDAVLIASLLVPLALTSLLDLWVMRRYRVIARRWQVINVVLNAIAFIALSRFFGPFVLVPGLCAVYSLAMQTHPEAWGRRLALFVTCGIAVVVVAAEVCGLVAATTTFGEGFMTIRTPGTLRASPTIALFVLANIAIIVMPSYFIAQVRNALARAERNLLLHTWYLERLLPQATR